MRKDLRKTVWIGALLASVVLVIFAARYYADTSSTGTMSAKFLTQGRQIYVDHCASCHGSDLEGQPDWKSPLPSRRLPAPPHDANGHTWLRRNGIRISMSGKGNCYDNAMVETFFKTLKSELVWRDLPLSFSSDRE